MRSQASFLFLVKEPRRALGVAALQRRLWLAGIFLLSLVSFRLQAQDPASAFDAANKLYEQGKYAEAASAYDRLLQAGHASASVYFNLGNALFKSSQIGRAIAAYRHAERITPRDPDLRANLQFARKQPAGLTLSPTPWERWLGKLTLNEWTLLAAVAGWFWFLLLAVFQWRPALRRSLRPALFLLGIAALLLGGCLSAAFYHARFTHTAIVVVKDAPVHYGPFDESPRAFTVSDGAELRLLDHKDDWLQVATDPRHIGWLRRDQIMLASTQ